MKFSELSKKDQISKVKSKFGDLVTHVLNDVERIEKLTISDESKKSMLTYVKTLDEKNKGCVCQECHDQEDFKKMPIDPAFEPLIEVAKVEAEKETY